MSLPDPINAWKFDSFFIDNGQKKVKDLFGSLDAVVDNFVLVPGRNGQALHFSKNGGAQRVSLGGTDLAPPWTMTTWVRREADTEGSTLISSRDFGLRLEQWQNLRNPGATEFNHNPDFPYSGGDFVIGAESQVAIGKWSFVQITGELGVTTFYLDGKLVGKIKQTINLPRSFIGSSHGSSEFLEGSLDDMKLYNCIFVPTPQLVVKDGAVVVPPEGQLDLGSVTQPGVLTKQLHIENHGTCPLHISGISVSDASGQFTVSPAQATTLAPDQVLDITVTYSGQTVGKATARIVISSDDPTQKEQAVVVSAQADAAPVGILEVTLAGQKVTAGWHCDYGKRIQGNSLSKTFRISNIGSAPFGVIGSSVAPNTNFTTQPLGSSTLLPGQSIEFTVTCLANQIGKLSAEVKVATTIGTITFTVDTSIDPVPVPQLVVKSVVTTPQGDQLDFDTVTQPQTIAKKITIANSGNGPLSISGLALVDATQQFTVSPAGPATLAPGQTLDVSLTYSGKSVGNAAAKLIINSNDPTQPAHQVALSGHAVAAPKPILEVTLAGAKVNTDAPIDYGKQTKGATVTKTFRIANVGTGSLKLLATAVNPSTSFTLQQPSASSLNATQWVEFTVTLQANQVGKPTAGVKIDTDSGSFSFTVSAEVEEDRPPNWNTDWVTINGVAKPSGSVFYVQTLSTPNQVTKWSFVLYNMGNSVWNYVIHPMDQSGGRYTLTGPLTGSLKPGECQVLSLSFNRIGAKGAIWQCGIDGKPNGEQNHHIHVECNDW